MEQNNFEKLVQQKLDELKIPPSESVWADVEKRIGKKDKDRKLIFILFFLIVFVLSGGYWLLNLSKNSQKKNQQVSNVITTESGSKSTNNQDSSFLKFKMTAGNNYWNIDSASASTRNGKNSGKQKPRKLVESEFKLKGNYSKETNNQDSEIALNTRSKLIEEKPDIFVIENENASDISKNKIQNKIKSNSSLNQLKTEKTTKKLIVKMDSSIKRSSMNLHKNPLILGITFSGGTSLIGENFLERNNQLADLYAGIPLGGIPYYYSPSAIKNSTAFIAGVFVEKNISPKIKFLLGISYKYFSLINTVGNKIDSSLSPSPQYLSFSNAYGSGNSSHSYRNNFHYLEVPVSFELQLNKNKKLPLSLNAGINVSQLIVSNALQFQPNTGLYYNNNSMFNKTQFGIHTGLSVTLLSAKKTALTIGPYFYYSATRLANQGLYEKKHFSFIGIKTEILFKRK